MSSPLERELPHDILDKVVEIGYTFGGVLGEGSCGKAYRCNWTDLNTHHTKLIAVKHINFNEMKKRRNEGVIDQKLTDPQLLNTIRVEIVAMNRVNHPNVVSLQNYVQFDGGAEDTTPSHLLIFMDIALSDLKTYQKRELYSEDQTCHFSAQIARGLRHIHSRGIAHFDLNPGNILVFTDQSMRFGVTLKITDFGLSVLFPIEPHGNTILPDTSTQVSDIIGCTPPFRDPIVDQILEGDQSLECDAFKADIWSYAVTVWYLMFGFMKGQRFMQEVNKASISPQMSDFLKRIFLTNQTERMSAVDVCDHQWLANEIIQTRERAPSFQ